MDDRDTMLRNTFVVLALLALVAVPATASAGPSLCSASVDPSTGDAVVRCGITVCRANVYRAEPFHCAF